MTTLNPVAWSWRFLTHDLWHIRPEDVRGVYRYPLNVLKAVFLSIRFFVGDRMSEKASALTYYTLLAIVPVVALVMAIARGFNFQDVIQNAFRQLFPAQDGLLDQLFGFAASYLEHTQTGLIMGIGVVMLLWVIINLIGNIEAVFNQIWQQKQSRTTLRKFTDYMSIVVIVPILIVLSSGLQIFLQTYLRTSIFDDFLSDSLQTVIRWTPYVLTVLVFTAAYIVIPNTKVKFINAFIAGIIAGTGFQAFQTLYISGQIWVSKYNAIYGSFAALPLLLLWVQMSWIICLYGAELAYASQNIRNYDFEKDVQGISRRYYDFLTILVASVVYTRFRQGLPAYTTEDIGASLHLPSKLTSRIVSDLADLGIILETVDTTSRDVHLWTPGRDISTYSIADLHKELDEHGAEGFKYEYERVFAKEWDILQQMRQAEFDAAASDLLSEVQLHESELIVKA